MENQEINVETVDVETVSEAPVVTDSMKATTAFGLGALAMGLLGGAIQGGVKVYRWAKKKIAERKKNLTADTDPQAPQLPASDEFSEFNE